MNVDLKAGIQPRGDTPFNFGLSSAPLNRMRGLPLLRNKRRTGEYWIRNTVFRRLVLGVALEQRLTLRLSFPLTQADIPSRRKHGEKSQIA